MKFLFSIMHPRRLDFFLESLKALDYVDILLAKNMELVTALTNIRDSFLEREYDYLLLTSDDVTIPYLAPYKIMKDVEETGYDIITGWSTSPDGTLSNIGGSKQLDEIEAIRKKGGYFPNKHVNRYTVRQVTRMLRAGKRIIPIWFTGWSITAMSRAVVENWTPRGWVFQKTAKWKPATYQGKRGLWCQADHWFSYETLKHGFRKYADLAVHVPHTKALLSTLRVGIEPPETVIVKARKPLKKVKS